LNFLQGQITNDTKRLAESGAMLAAYLNPQGRAIALLHLLSHSTGTLAVLPRELKQPIAERMRKFILRAKVRVEDPGESLAVYGYHGPGALAQAGLPEPGAGAGYVESDGLGVARVGKGPRYWVVAAPHAGLDPKNEEAAQAGATAGGVESDWRRADIEEGLPQVYGVTSEAFVAQMLNLDLLDGISFSKGCYTGQEIVARTQHLGRIKRRLFHLRLPRGGWHIGEEIALRDGRRGRLTEVIEGEHGSEALAVLTLEPLASYETASPETATPGSAATGSAATGAAATGSAAAGTEASAARVTAAEQVPLPYALA